VLAMEEKIAKQTEIKTALQMLNRLSDSPIDRKNVARPPRGKKLTIPAAYAYMNENPDGRAIVAEEFWVQVKKDANEYGCWNVLFPVGRTKKGTIKKLAYIHWFRKRLGAVRLAWFLSGLPFNFSKNVGGETEKENLYNECENDLCVNPAHHFQGATGKMKKRRDRAVKPETAEASYQELDEYANAVFSYLCDKWGGVTFKELTARLVGPKNEVPDAESLRKCLQTKRAKSLMHLKDNLWLPNSPEEEKCWKCLGSGEASNAQFTCSACHGTGKLSTNPVNVEDAAGSKILLQYNNGISR